VSENETVLTCSRAGCPAEASAQVVWRNPRIHDESRRKVWLACAEHEGYLSEYLAARDFPVAVIALEAVAEEVAL
jgi:hypothetical protein